jgi:outer membrane protein assembly factor BamB
MWSAPFSECSFDFDEDCGMASRFWTIQPINAGNQGRLYRLTTPLLVVMLALVIGHVAGGDEKKRPTGGNARAASTASVSVARNAVENQGQSAQRRLFGHLLYRNRQQQVMLSRAAGDLADGKTTDGLIYLQTLLDASEDGFAWLGPESRLVSVRREALRILGAQSPQVLRAYERINGAEAAQLLEDARRTGEPNQFREVGRRFYFTSAGFEAIDWQASRWLDQGRPGQAARAWKQLISEPAHKRRVKRSMLAKAAVAHRLAGHLEAAAEIVQQLDGRQFRLGDGTKADIGLLTRRLTKTALAVDFARRAVLPGGHEDRQADRVSTPFLEPLWKRRYTAGQSELLDALVGQWENKQRENLQPVAVANSAVVAGSAVVVRDFGYIRAVDASTGKLRWSYRCATSLATISRDAPKRGGSLSSSAVAKSVDVKNAYAGNATLGMLSTDGHRVYAVDFLDLSKKSRSSGRFSNLSQRSSKTAVNIVSREANRLIALNVDPNSENDEQQQPIWSIGGAVGTPEWFTRMDRNFDGRIVQAEFIGDAEQFHKIDTNTDSAIGLREAADFAGWSDRRNPLGGHFFLGPPLPVDGCLYAVTEADRQLNLVAIKPENGELLWMQAIGFVEVPIDRDRNRYPLHCTPSFADGILVCPTQLGLLVGVDSLTGSLLWAYYYGDSETLAHLGRWPHRSQRSYGHPGFPSIAHVDSGRVVVLPRQSNSIHCLDLRTGQPLWKIPRDDAEYIGTVRDDMILIVGARACRGLSLDTGDEIWRTRLGMPSGRGLPAGRRYLVPLQQGRIATLDLSTGREIGFTLPRSQGDSELTAANETDESPHTAAGWHPGNLIAIGDLVLSAGSRRLVAFRQSASLLATIERDLNGGSASTEEAIRLAELGLALGRIDRAREQLTTILAETMPDHHRDRAEALLRELLYLELKQHAGNDRLFAQLEQLSRSPTLRGRFLMQRAEAQLQQRNFVGVLESTRELSALNLSRPLPTVNDPSLQVTAAGWLPGIIGRVQEQFGSHDLAGALVHIDAEQQQALSSTGVSLLEQFLTVYSLWPQADAPRAELARRYVDAGRFQEAELLLLANRSSNNKQTAAVATTILAQLWDRLGLWQEAAGLMNELDERFADVRLDNDRTGRDFSALFTPSSLTAHALRQRRLPNWRVLRVDISERPWTEANPELIETYGRYRRRFATGGGMTYQLLVKGSSGDEKLAVIDRPTGKIVAHVSIPSRVSYPSSGKTANIGHFIP